MKMRTTFVILIITFSLSIVTCSNNSSNSDGEGNGTGSVSFQLSGDAEGEKEGQAVFDIVELAGVYNVIISFHDLSPTTFTLEFILTTENETQVLSTGSHEIGEPELDKVFQADYTAFTGTQISDRTEYTTFEGGFGGTLNVTKSTDKIIEGTFEFTAGRYDDETGELIGQISVTDGEFHAVEDPDL